MKNDVKNLIHLLYFEISINLQDTPLHLFLNIIYM